MRKVTIAVISVICFVNIVSAQTEVLTVQGVSPDLYLIHKPAAKENYYSVGRLYNVPPKDIAAYNNLVFETGLQLGQPIKIPLTQNNFIQTPANDGLAIPLYHTVEAKEGLYRVSVNYNKVPLEQLKKWNHLSSDAVSSGTKLIIGYLKVQQESPLAKNAENKTEVVTIPKSNVPAAKKIIDTPKEIAAEAKNSNAIKPTNAAKNTTSAVTEETQDIKNIPVVNSSVNFNGGAFKKLYDDQQGNKLSINETGVSGVFKSTSGWRDGKYYCFHNNAPAGTILKITNTINGKSIYAKVLDLIPDINQNTGLILHLSNAASEELGVTSTRFNCSIDYSK